MRFSSLSGDCPWTEGKTPSCGATRVVLSLRERATLAAYPNKKAGKIKFMIRCVCLFLVVLIPAAAEAGLYYSGESYAAFPAQWRGFLLDHRALRNLAQKPLKDGDSNPGRTRYLEEAAKLEKTAKQRDLTADEIADLGALHVRLGEAGKAVTLLRPAQRRHPNHFRLAANLSTAWQLHGDLSQAALCLEQAVRLAPGKLLHAEELHLTLVRGRLRHGPKSQELDDLFGVRYVGDKGDFAAGKLALAQKKKLPAKAVALAQQLALWLPADGPLLWQLAELANAHGDVRTAAAMFDGCVIQFNLGSIELRRRRQLARAAVEQMAKLSLSDKSQHEEGHAGAIAFRSRRPLQSRFDATELPPISATGVNLVPWDVFTETTVEAKFRPAFGKYLRDLEGKQVVLHGFMQPIRDDQEMGVFLFVEYPIGCWYCEMPETAGIIFIELADGKTTTFTRGLLRVTGRLTLNATDPEDFFYALRDARVGSVN